MTRRCLTRVRRPTVLWAAAGVLALIQCGCIPVPAFSHRTTYGAEPPEEQIGGPASRRPVQVGRSTREDVLYLLGPPKQITPDGRVFVYEYDVVKGHMVSLLPFFVFPQTDREYLRLQFDAQGRLECYKGQQDLSDYHHRLDRGQLMPYSHYRQSTGASEAEMPLPPLAPVPAEQPEAPP